MQENDIINSNEENNADPHANAGNQENKADLDAGKPEKPTAYKIFQTKEDHSKYMENKTKSLKKTIENQENELKKLRTDSVKNKFKTKIIFLNNEKKVEKPIEKKIKGAA